MSGLAIPGCARADSFRLRDFRGVDGAQGLRLLIRFNPFAFTCSTNLPGRPDSPVPTRVTIHLYSTLSTCSRKTVLPRFNHLPPVACRGLRPCPLCHLSQSAASAVAEATSSPKQHRSSTLTHASRSCRKSPVSHARPRHQGHKNLSGSEAAQPPLRGNGV